MKKLSKLIYALAALPLLFTSCVEEVLREPGAPDLEDCYGVYFKKLSKAQSKLELDPSDPTVLTLTALRPTSEDLAELPAITVPVDVVCADDKDGNKLFQLDEITFEEGQTETTFDVTFPNAEVGKTYVCKIEINDHQYASIYSENPAFVSFSVTRVEWKKLGKGLFRDAILSDYAGLSGFKNPTPEVEVEMYERADKPGLYKLINPYNIELLADLTGEKPSASEKYKIAVADMIIDATNPKKVWIPALEIGVSFGSKSGPVIIGSFHHENLNISPAESVTGVMNGGVIKFPKSSFITFDNRGGWVSNLSGLTRIILPGCKDVDYTLSIETGESLEGKLPVELTLGQDIEKLKYATTSGKLSDLACAELAEKIVDGSLESTELKKTETAFDVELAESGVYTMIVVAFDKTGKKVAHNNTTLYYLAKDDENPVVLTCGLIVSDKYINDNATAENSVEAYIVGKDLQSVKYNLYTDKDLPTQMDALLEDLTEEGIALDDKELKEANGEGWSAVIDKLMAGTDYYLGVLASNGYTSKVFLKHAKTLGIPDPLQKYYSISDIEYTSENLPLITDYCGQDWALYQFNKDAKRVNLGKVNLAEGNPVEGKKGPIPTVDIQGLWTAAAPACKLKPEEDIYTCIFSGGILQTYNNLYGKKTYKKKSGEVTGDLAGATVCFDSEGVPFTLPGLKTYVGFLTAEGNIAFISSGMLESLFEQQGLEFEVGGLSLVLYDDLTLEIPEELMMFGLLYDFLLVNPKNVAPEKPEKASVPEILENLKLSRSPFKLSSFDLSNYDFTERVGLNHGQVTDIDAEYIPVPVANTISNISSVKGYVQHQSDFFGTDFIVK